MKDLRGLDEILRRQTSTVHAGAADRPLLGHHRRLVQLLRSQRSRKGGGARPEDEEIEGFGHAS